MENLSPSQEGEVPAELGEYVFGGEERTYAVFDTASVSEGLALVEGEPGFCGSLLAGSEAEDLADVMPCLLELTPESEISRRLFREVPDHPAALGTLHLWPANPALFIRCKSSPDQLRSHLRRFMKPADSTLKSKISFLGKKKLFLPRRLVRKVKQFQTQLQGRRAALRYLIGILRMFWPAQPFCQ